MNTLKANAVHMKFSMEQKGVSEFSLGTSESEADERYLLIHASQIEFRHEYWSDSACAHQITLEIPLFMRRDLCWFQASKQDPEGNGTQMQTPRLE